MKDSYLQKARFVKSSFNMNSSPIADAMNASAGGLFALCALYPLDLLRTKIAAEAFTSKENVRITGDDGKKKEIFFKDGKSSSVWRELALIVHGNGFLELYRGFFSRAAHCLFFDLIYYYTYTSLMINLKRRTSLSTRIIKDTKHKKRVNIIDLYTSVRLGTIAGIVTNILTIPVDTVSMNLQISKSIKRKGIFELTRKIYEEYGILKFWNGLLPACVLTINPAINVALFENMKSGYLSKYEKEFSSVQQLSAFEAFVFGTLSKGVATVITYPMIRFKTLLLKANEDNNEDERKKVRTDIIKPCKISSSILIVIKEVLDHEGIAGFYRGMYVQLLRSTTGSGLMFMVREALR